MRPSVVGYIRVASGVSERMTQNLLNELAGYAEREGYELAEVFTEREESGSSAFAALIDELTRSNAPIVLVPSLFHFAQLPGLRVAMKAHVEQETGARVVAITE